MVFHTGRDIHCRYMSFIVNLIGLGWFTIGYRGGMESDPIPNVSHHVSHCQVISLK